MNCERVRIESISNEHGFPLYSVRMNNDGLQVEARTVLVSPGLLYSPVNTYSRSNIWRNFGNRRDLIDVILSIGDTDRFFHCLIVDSISLSF